MYTPILILPILIYIAIIFSDVCRTQPILVGGGQEGGLRGGTENTLLIAALGEASYIAYTQLLANMVHMLTLKLRMVRRLIETFGNPEDSHAKVLWRIIVVIAMLLLQCFFFFLHKRLYIVISYVL